MINTNTKQINLVKQLEKKFSRLDVSSAWKGLEYYIPSIIDEFNIANKTALEFGVDHGYSTHILSQLFETVIGVDSFVGDAHIIHEQGNSFYNDVKQRFENTNVDIVRSSFQDFIKTHSNSKYNLVHIDIVHEYEPTFECAEWAVQHSDVVILHDTVSFPAINKVCVDISSKHNNILYYNIPEHFGLGVLYKSS